MATEKQYSARIASRHSTYQTTLYLWGTDALDAVEKLQKVLTGPDCEYQLLGCREYRNKEGKLCEREKKEE